MLVGADNYFNLIRMGRNEDKIMEWGRIMIGMKMKKPRVAAINEMVSILETDGQCRPFFR